DGDESHAQGYPDLVDLHASLDQRHRLPREPRHAARRCLPRRDDRRLIATTGASRPARPGSSIASGPRLASEDGPRTVEGAARHEIDAASARAFAPEMR